IPGEGPAHRSHRGAIEAAPTRNDRRHRRSKVPVADRNAMSHGEGLAPPKRHWVMLCVLLGIALANLSSAIVNIALPDISRSFASSHAATVWVVNAYQVAGMVCLLPIAALGESLGLKRVYAAGLAIFTLASLACALSPTLTVLIGARLF